MMNGREVDMWVPSTVCFSKVDDAWVVAHALCQERTPEVMQAVMDAAPPARGYFSDAFNTYREFCYWGEHRAMYNKSQTYSVEGDNAELRYYLARLTRRSAIVI